MACGGMKLVYLLLALSFPTELKAKDFNPDNPLNAPSPVYWCPGKPADQQIATKQTSHCQPLYDKQTEESFRASARQQGFDLPDRDPIKIVELQNAASKFTDRYNKFLSCCLTDSDAIPAIIDLVDESNRILKSVQEKGIFNAAGFGVRSATVGTIAGAREDLLKLKQRLENLAGSQQSLSGVEYETSGRMKRQIQDEEDAIRKEFKSTKPPPSAPTGMDIKDTTLRSRFGEDIEDTKLNPNFGADIGYTESPYSNVGESLRPRRGEAIQDSQLPQRPGTELQDTAIPNTTGFDIDRVENPDGSSAILRRGIGPSIGDSELNSKRR